MTAKILLTPIFPTSHASTVIIQTTRSFFARFPSQSSVRCTSSSSWTKSRPFECAPWVQPGSTKGTIRFLGPTTDGRPAYLNFKKGEEHQTNIGPSVEGVYDVTDLRHFEPRTTLPIEGVEWVQLPSCMSEDRLLQDNPQNAEAFVRGEYFEECGNIVRERTGATRVIPYNYRHRRIEMVRTLSSGLPHRHNRASIFNFHPSFLAPSHSSL